MVQSYQSPVRVYKYPFELIMAAYVRRFPTCDMIPIMADTEIISEEVSEDGSSEVIARRCKLHVEAPYLLKKIMGVEFLLFVQTNTLDKRRRTLYIEAKNESFLSRVVINENCKYFVHPENSDWTCYEQSASLDVKSFFGFESTVEKLAMKQYSQNISKGKEIIEYFIAQLKEEGITSVPKWERLKKASLKKSAVKRTSSSKTEQQVSFEEGPEAEEQLNENQKPPTLSNDREDEDDDDEEEAVEYEESEDSSQPNTEIAESRRKDAEETMSKLDSDYIMRCLGNLTPLQESRLVQLKKSVTQLQKGKVPRDATLLRFLRARDYNLEKAREMLSHSLIWRKKNQIDKMLANYQPPQVIKDFFPGSWHYQDKEGRPLYLLRLGLMDVKGLSKSVGEEGLLRHTLYICEEGLRLTAEATCDVERPITTWTLLVDLEGLNMRHLWRPGVKTLLKIIEIVENNYPETMSHVLIIRAPRVFPILWTLVSPFIDDNTRTKFLFYAGNDYQCSGGLVDYIDKRFIPDFLGGDCKSSAMDRGLVPKNLYLPGEDAEGGCQKPPPLLLVSDESIYHSVSLNKGQVHEVVLLIEEASSVICWDFDVMKSDLVFRLLRTKIPITHSKEPHSPTSAMGVIDAVMGTDECHRSAIEKGWREGVEYFQVEPPLVCHDGESVQGSHVTEHMGTYIVQWKYYEPPHTFSHNSPLDIIDSFTSHKAKLMYYYEVLKSADYKGSMTSLESCHSGFSHLSSSTGKSSNNSSSGPSR